MKEQNYKNHSQYVIGYHIVTLLFIIIVLVYSIKNLLNATTQNMVPAVMMVVLSFILLCLYYYTRKFALIAQDRAIKAEEQLRYFILTGKRLDHTLTVGQIIALRFASDEELPALAARAVKENLSNSDIKKSITNWRADWYRV